MEKLVMLLLLGYGAVTQGAIVNRYSFIDGDTAAVDSISGRNGTLQGTAAIAGNQLVLNGAGAVNLPGDILNPALQSVTIENWFQITTVVSWQRLFDFGDTSSAGGGFCLFYTPTGAGTSRFVIGTNGFPSWQTGEQLVTATAVPVAARTHIACVYDGVARQLRLYQNGVLLGTTPTTMPLASVHRAFAYIGDSVYTADPFFKGSVDEFRIYDTALTDAEVRASFNAGPEPERASNPNPPYGGNVETLNATLSWKPGAYAKKHDVYFGTDLNIVHDANRTNPMGVLVGQDREPNNYPVSGFTYGTTYYWRIDEVNGVNVSRGNIWRFLVQPTKAWDSAPDDGEIYVSTDPNLSWNSGANSTKSNVYFGTSESTLALEKTITHTAGVGRYSYAKTGLNGSQVYYWRVDQVQSTGPDITGDLWSFKTMPFMPKTDPNLVGWWKFDEGEGAVILDWSGHDRRGTIYGANWVSGYDGNALYFNGVDANDYVDLSIGSVIASLGSCTIATWVNFSNTGGSFQRIFDFGGGIGAYMFLTPRVGTTGVMRFAIRTDAIGEQIVNAPSTLASGWHHVAVVMDSTSMAVQLYQDGIVVASGTTQLLPRALGITSQNWLGRSQWAADAYLAGALDDFRIYDKALTPEEMKAAMRGDPLRAWDPRPANNSTPDVEHVSSISWSPGDKAAQHDVYLGADANAVEAAGAATPGIYRDRWIATSYTPTEALQVGKAYYWRIDEYNTDATVTKGVVWTFAVAPYLAVDDFEAYDDVCNKIYYAWRDGGSFDANSTCGVAAYAGNGTGSQVGNPFAERTIVHLGRQSMPVRYNNSVAPYYSETKREWATPQDWTRRNIKSLSLWFRGVTPSLTTPANAPATLYIIIIDSLNNSKTLTYPDPSAAVLDAWQEWIVEMKDISSAGVNLASIKSMAIGMDNRADIQTAGTGTMYFDDILLYPPRCRADVIKPVSDLNNDCVVNEGDVDVLVDHWLGSALVITPVAPTNTGLAGYWKFDDGSGITAADSSGNARTGLASGDPQWVAGHDGGALRFDGTDDYVDLPIGTVIASASSCTITTWVNFSNTGGAWQRIFDFGVDPNFYMFLSPRVETNGVMRFAMTTTGAGGTASEPSQLSAPSTLATGWHHVAVLIDGATGAMQLWLDGGIVASGTTGILPRDLGNTTNNWLGRSQYDADAYFAGRLDDFRIYSRALSVGEVASLAGRTARFSDAYDLNLDGAVNFKDFAVLASAWLEQKLWSQP